MIFEYPIFFPNFRFIGAVWIVTLINYYINLQDIPVRIKYISTFIGFCLILLIPIPFFAADRNFGAIPLATIDYRGYLPFTLLFVIPIMLRFYSLQIEMIKGTKAAPSYLYILPYMFTFPHYVYDPEGSERKRPPGNDNKPRIKQLTIFLTWTFGWIVTIIIFYFLPVPTHPLVTCFKNNWWWFPIIMVSGISTIIMFMMISTIGSFISNFYNYVAGYNFKYYSDKPFLSTSIGEFWKRWNLWTNDFFYIYMYSPLRRKWKLTHYQTVFAVFTVSGFIHAYIIALINWPMSWMAFLFFFGNGLAIIIESATVKKFPVLSKIPVPVKYTLTMFYLVFTMGLFGFCFSY